MTRYVRRIAPAGEKYYRRGSWQVPKREPANNILEGIP